MPRLLQALLRERRAVKARIKQLTDDDASGGGGGGGASGTNSDLIAVLDARQLPKPKPNPNSNPNPNPKPKPNPNPDQVLKLLANASYGFCGADTSHLCCKPLVNPNPNPNPNPDTKPDPDPNPNPNPDPDPSPNPNPNPNQAEACLRWGNFYCATASQLIEEEGAGHAGGAGGAGPRWPGAAVIYANTDSVFVRPNPNPDPNPNP
eukprot:scaffold16317_cov59-Phaeocystis_antarctica.AAC.2